jgi:hypothetical protein
VTGSGAEAVVALTWQARTQALRLSSDGADFILQQRDHIRNRPGLQPTQANAPKNGTHEMSKGLACIGGDRSSERNWELS